MTILWLALEGVAWLTGKIDGAANCAAKWTFSKCGESAMRRRPIEKEYDL